MYPGGPARLLDVEPVVFLAFMEGIVREDEESANALDTLYRDAQPKPAVSADASRAERNAAIARLARLTS